jgi:2-oxoglutarate ferredoxin oxidoreductase subunit gamma
MANNDFFKKEIRLAGSGGQGLITAGIILAEAAILDGFNVVQSQSYGPEARGGASKAEVIISNREIYYPKANNPDILLAMNQESCDKYFSDLKPNSLFIVDTTFVKTIPTNNVYGVPITKETVKTLKKELFSNIVALGVLCEISKVVSRRNLTKAVLNRVPEDFKEQNEKALKLGYKIGKKVLKDYKISGEISADE